MTELTTPILIYLGIVVLLGLTVLSWTSLSLWRTRRKGEQLLAERKLVVPLPTESPVDDPERQARSRGIESIRQHFSVTQRVALPLIVGLTALAAALPFVSQIPAAFLSLIAAGITVLVGMAARPAVENAIAGLLISYSKLLSIGDTIRIDENYGTVEDVTSTHTTIKLWDWRRYVIPNREMLQARFINYTLFDRYLWTYVEFFVDYSADLSVVRDLATAATKGSAHYAGHEEPQFWVMGLERDAIRCWVAGWADTPGDGWVLAADIRTALANELRERGIASHGLRVVEGPRAAGAAIVRDNDVESQPPGAPVGHQR
jgi:small-conductance mechanosensitive channel